MKANTVISNSSPEIKFMNILELYCIILPWNCPNSVVVVMHEILSLPLGCDCSIVAPLWSPSKSDRT